MFIPEYPTLSPRHFISIKHEAYNALPYPLSHQNKLFFYLARNGIYHLFKKKKTSDWDTVLVPDYHHGNEIRAIIAAGWKVRFYHIGWDLTFSLNEIEELIDDHVKGILVIHYLGWPQKGINQLKQICNRKGIWLLEDCALAFLAESSSQPVGTVGDYAIFCLYKTLPVPNGAVLASNKAQSLPENGSFDLPGKLSTLSRSFQLGMDWVRLKSGFHLNSMNRVKQNIGSLLTRLKLTRVGVGDSGFDVNAANLSMSDFAQKILMNLDYVQIRSKRRKNFQILHQFLNEIISTPFTTLGQGTCPLFYPILVKDKMEFIHKMHKKGIMAVPFWNHGHAFAQKNESEPCRFFRRHLAELPLHQDLDAKHLEYIASCVKEEAYLLIKEMPKKYYGN